VITGYLAFKCIKIYFLLLYINIFKFKINLNYIILVSNT
jgi:hypothetical protein